MARGKALPRAVVDSDDDVGRDTFDEGDSECAPESGVEVAAEDKLETTNDAGQTDLEVADRETGEGLASERGAERRRFDRIDVEWSVDCATEETFLYASIRNISTMGIFVQTRDPLVVGTKLTLRFTPPPRKAASLEGTFVLQGTVQWVNDAPNSPNPGMGIRFAQLTLDDRERIVEAIRTIAYLRDDAEPRLLN